ncbi:hypothetical protein K443DRAFT_672854 [Laccaria amethystina LaAM-08-1]|jgi:hypothetical protein|uniref:Uncharacterized protein n=1 Tax=Laccaria amethystina LaAM-08-1 TaxID=1095629 RepID=A0A0C9YIV9_9AGAR|nr:hypothetical protein K443DRAFT_672854 [Laccaria amethystina LaAM-08-1]
MDLFVPLISQGYEIKARADKRWYKIKIDGVRTHILAGRNQILDHHGVDSSSWSAALSMPSQLTTTLPSPDTN